MSFDKNKPSIDIFIKDDDDSTNSTSNHESLAHSSLLYDGSRWDLSHRNMGSTISLSQVSLATTNTAEASSSFLDYHPHHCETDQQSPEMNSTSSREDGRPLSGGYYGTTIINEKHANFVLMYDMLTGIRIAVPI